MDARASLIRTFVILGIVGLVFLVGCGGKTSVNNNTPPPPPASPSIASISPQSATAGAPGFTLTVSGSNFVQTSVAQWDGSNRPTTFISSTQLTAAISSDDIGTGRTVEIQVVNPISAGRILMSNMLTFTVNNPAPSLASLSPSSVQAGAAPFPLTVNGSAFVSNSTVQWNGSIRPTSFISNTQLTALIRSSDVTSSGTAQVTVVNPSPGGGTSAASTFTTSALISNPSPSIASLSDTSAPAGWPGFPLAVNGSGFVAASVGQFNGLNRPTTVFSSSLLKAAIPASDLATASNAQVTVFNSSPGGGLSNAVALTVKSVLAGAVGTVERSSLATDLTEADKGSRAASITADGRFVVFSSDASNLVPGDTNGFTDVFLRDTCINGPPGCVPSTERVSVASDGTESNGFSGEASISANGRFVAFVSDATNLVPGDTNNFPDVFVRDTCFGASAGCMPSTTRVSLNDDGSQILLENHEPTLSAGGRFVAFASGLSGGYYSNDNFDVLVRDTCVGAPSGCKPSTTHVAVANDGTAANGSSDLPAISSSGRFVAFRSAATNLVAGDTNKAADVFVHDTCFGAPTGCTPSTVRVSVASDGTEADRDSGGLTISADGRFIAFTSIATNLVTGDTNSSQDVFVRDTCLGAASSCKPSTFRVSVASDGTQADSNSDSPAISADGRFVAFSSGATNLVANDTNKLSDVFVRDTCFGAPAGCTPSTVRVSVTQDGTQANGDSVRPAISGDGRFVAFESTASNLAPGDTNTATDILVARTGFNPSTASSSLASSAAAKHPVVAAEAKLNAAVFAPPRSTNLQQSVLRSHRSPRIAP